MSVTGAVIARNEVNNIAKCIHSLDFCDEIIVIDDYSTDNTAQIAEKLGAKVYKRKLIGDYASQRNYALNKSKSKWVLFVDADEIVSDALIEELSNINLQNTKTEGFFIKRRDVFMDKEVKHGESGNIKLLRLGKKNSGKWKRKVHEYWDIDGNVGELGSELVHYSHKTLEEFIERISKYSKIHAEENKNEGKTSGLFKIIVFPMGKFLHNYFIKLAILDGVRGFVLSVFMSFHSFVSWSSLWLKKINLIYKK